MPDPDTLCDASCEKELSFETGIDVKEVIHSTFTMIEIEFEQGNVSVSVDLPDNLPTVASNRIKLGQLIRLLFRMNWFIVMPGSRSS
ncbi:MAG: hypothetical protein ACKVHP_07395 [Verrucomicrobiales bacterium]